jgi:hypothetical protein
MERQHCNLYVSHLTPEMASRTCGPYYYTVTDMSMAHIAFCTKEHLDLWMAERGLSLKSDISKSGSGSEIKGHYYTDCTMNAVDLLAMPGIRTRRCSNGQYTLCVITEDADGNKIEHYANPNCKDRVIYDYRESRNMIG